MLSQDEKIAHIRNMEFFRTVPADQLAQFVRYMDEVRYNRDDVILREGEQGDAMFFIVEGTVSVLKQEIRALNLGPGSCIGEMALLDNDPRSATIVASTDVATLRLRRDDFDELLNSTPVMQGMYRILVQKIRVDLDAYVESIRTQEQVKQDLRRAREIQEAMLPATDLAVGNVYVTGICRPAESIGGDYYDHMVLSDSRVGVFIGDAAGHGFHSGLIGAMIKSGLFTQLEVNSDVLAVMATVNRIVHRHGPDWIFFTACFIVFDLAKKTLRYSNAGHPPPLHYQRRTGRIKYLETTSYPAGFSPEIEQGVGTRSWEHGDIFVLYSDGVIEAENAERVQFGFERLEQGVRASVHLSPRDLKQAILAQVAGFTQSGPQKDDITVVVVHL